MAQIVKTIGGRELGFKFTMLTITKYCEMRGIAFSDYDKDMAKNVLTSSNALFRAAVDVYSKGEEIITEYDMDDLLDEMSQDDYADIIKCYAEGMQNSFAKLTGRVEDKKKEAKKK